MNLYLCLFGALLIGSAKSENSTLSKIPSTSNKNLDVVKMDLVNKTNIVLESEGGKLLPNTPDLSLPKEKLNSLITLDEEISKPKEQTVVARKGVNMETEDKSSVQNQTASNLKPVTSSTKSSTAVTNKSTAQTVVKNITSTETKLAKTEAPKKPKVLSYEALASMEKQLQSEHSKIPTVPSTKTMASSQIPSPNQDVIKKVYPSKANNNHPGMIMPIVITILVVPMFAIVGYFALKRGQEAWKNRHYKRMDFLLDGMYND